MDDQGAKIMVIVLGCIPFAVIGLIIYKFLFDVRQIKKRREQHAQQLHDFQQQCCRSLEQQALQKEGRAVRYRAETSADGSVNYIPTPLDGHPYKGHMPEKE